MLTENPTQESQTGCNHERSHIGLDAAYCPACNKSFRPRSKEYQQLLQRPLVVNHPDPKPGDYVTLLGDRPQRLYQIVKIAGGHATCRPLDGDGSDRNAAFWKLRAYCPVDDKGETHTSHTPPPDCSKALTLLPPPPNQVSGVELAPVTSDTPPPDQVSGVTLPASTPDTLEKHNHWVEVYRPNGRKTQYFRYVWMTGQKMHHIHIPGGHVRLPKAQSNLAVVKDAIAQSRSPAQILELIRILKAGG